MLEKPIYLDYAATTPVDESVANKMSYYLTREGCYGNASSKHTLGKKAKLAIDHARQHLATLIACSPDEIIWTSGATEANNLAIKGIAYGSLNRGNHLITSQIEHKAVLNVFHFLEQQGFDVTYVQPNKKGIIELRSLEKAVRPSTILISIMHINNETGAIQDVHEMAKFAEEKAIFFHSDAAQSIGKIPINLKESPISSLSISAHKFYGPKGIGALFLRKNVPLIPLFHGGDQEGGYRSGTLATHQIVGIGEASQLAYKTMDAELIRINYLENKLRKGLETINHVIIHAEDTLRYSGILNMSFKYVDGKKLVNSFSDSEIAVSSGSACASAELNPSYVLKSMGVSEELALSSIRFSIGRYTTEQEIDFTIKYTHDLVNKIRNESPLWLAYQKITQGS